jgi:hypothetical protein
MQAKRTGAGPLLALVTLVGAAATASAADAQQASFCGVVRFTGRTCVTVPGSGRSTGRTFDISDLARLPRRNTTIAGSGTVRGISHCSRATGRLAHVTWRRVTVCPQAR